MTTLPTFLRAGGLVPVDAALPPGEALDVVHARVFRHPALGERPIVRLSAAALAAGEDAEMEFLGFAPGQDLGAVGQRRRRAPGFPGWALIHDPQHAGYALGVVRELKRALRDVGSRPGAAKETIDDIGERLARSVPHFLPSFYEEAGRGFLGGGNTTYAAQYFEKAREAERVHGLKVDEALRLEAFLEFALAGAVSIKSLTAYARDLRAAYSPAEAYAGFRELAVRRTAGGLPPWAGMAKELRGLASAAKLDAAAEDAAVLRAVLECPALKRAPVGFWKDYRKAIVAVAKETPSLRGALLNLFPAPSGQADDFESSWLDLLDDCGALEAVCAPRDQVPAAAAPHEGAAAWLKRLTEHLHRSYRSSSVPEKVPRLVERMAARLKADGAPVRLQGRWESQWHADLTDLALSLGIPVADPDEGDSIELDDWAEHAGDPGMGRDLTFLAADARFLPLLEAGVDAVAGESTFEAAARGRPGLTELRRKWLIRLLEQMDTSALPDLEERLSTVREKTSAATFAEFPEAHPVLQARRVAPALARTLRAGFIDELGWPALEAALAELGPERWIGGTWPYLVLATRTRLIVVGPEGRVLDRTWSCPKKAEVKDLRFADGQALVLYRISYSEEKGFWTGAPKNVFDADIPWGDLQPSGYAAHLPGGGVCEGHQVLRAGDTEFPGRDNDISWDGATLWKAAWRDGEHGLFELDPATGELGRRSLPRFLEDFAAPGRELDLGASYVFALPAGVDSPLGSRDGFTGFRVRRAEDGEGPREYEGADGRRFVGEPENSLIGLLRLPGDLTPRPVMGERSGRWADPTKLLAADGSFVASDLAPAYTAGSGYVPPHEYWHFLAPRDAAVSAALRALGDDAAEALLAAARADRAAEAEARPALRAALATHLPAPADPRFTDALVGVVDYAASLAESLGDLTTAREAEEAAVEEVGGIGGRDLREPLSGLGLFDHSYDSALSAHLAAAARFFGGEKAAVPDSDDEWWAIADATGAIAWRAAFTLEDEQRDLLLRFLEVWAGLSFLAQPERLRVCRYEGRFDAKVIKPRTEDDEGGWTTLVYEGNRYLLKLGDYEYEEDSSAVEYAPDGTFRDLPGATLAEVTTVKADPFGPELRAFVAACRSRGRVPWTKKDAARIAELTGLTTGEAALLLPGYPNLGSRWESNFLPKELREALGLKVKEAAAGRDALARFSADQRRAVLVRAIGGLGDALWEGWGSGDPARDGVERLAAAWLEQFGRRLAIPEDLLAGAGEIVDDSGTVWDLLTAFAAPRDGDLLGRDGAWRMNRYGNVECDEEGVFSGETLESVTRLIPWLFAERPVGDPFRAGIPQALARMRARLANPDLLLDGLRIAPDVEGDEDDAQEKAVRQVLESLGGDPVVFKGDEDDEPRAGRDTGLIVAVADDWGVDLAVRAARLDDPLAVERLVGERSSRLRAVMAVRSAAFDALAARVAATPVPEGGYEANPLLSAPDVVAEVAAKHGLSDDAAALYLQTLTLAQPTTAAVRQWNDWTAGRYTKAAAALVEAGLVVEAKRKRAGRAHFLPGAWEPDWAIEAWKVPLYEATRDAEGDVQLPLDRWLALEPLHLLFRRAWDRVKSGDAPRYEDVK